MILGQKIMRDFIQTNQRVSGISGMEWWNGLLEWNTGMDWDKIFALACNLKCYMDQVDSYYMINYASMTLGTADHVGVTLIIFIILQPLIN